LERLEERFAADGMFFYGPIYPGVEKHFRDFLERLRAEPPDRNRLVIFLNTTGGSAETVETLVDVIRFNYREVWFVIPDFAMSAGTIFCMSGDRIWMDYSSSSLGAD
jgi:ClpP class serine protease